MSKKKYLVCAKCGKRDKPDTSTIPYNVGTSTEMRCPDCADSTGYASMCRACCPTGHGDYTQGWTDADEAIKRKLENSNALSVDYSQGNTAWDKGWNARLDLENKVK